MRPSQDGHDENYQDNAYNKLEYAYDICKDNPKGILNYIEKFDKSRNRSYKDFLDPMMVEWLNEK